jgi:large subunit ribosomal protein L21e
MGKRKGGYRRKTRKLMKKNVRDHGKIRLSSYFAKYNDGDKVTLFAEPAVQDSLYNLRFHGKIGTVRGMQGACYKVAILDGNKPKTVIVHPIHLKRADVKSTRNVAPKATKAAAPVKAAPVAKVAAAKTTAPAARKV